MPDDPAGVAVLLDGVAHGKRPARVSVTGSAHPRAAPPRHASHEVLHADRRGRRGLAVSRAADDAFDGDLYVRWIHGARVTINDPDHGVAPVSIADLGPASASGAEQDVPRARQAEGSSSRLA